MSFQPKLSKSNFVMTQRASATSNGRSALDTTVSSKTIIDQISDIDESDEEGRSCSFATSIGSLEDIPYEIGPQNAQNTNKPGQSSIGTNQSDGSSETGTNGATPSAEPRKGAITPAVRNEELIVEDRRSIPVTSNQMGDADHYKDQTDDHGTISCEGSTQKDPVNSKGQLGNTNPETDNSAADLSHGPNREVPNTRTGACSSSTQEATNISTETGCSVTQESMPDTQCQRSSTPASTASIDESDAKKRVGFVRPEARGVSTNSDLLMALNNSLGLRSLREYCLRGAHMLRECIRQTDEMQAGLMYLAHGTSKHRHAIAVLPFESETVHEGQMVITHGTGSSIPHRPLAPPCGLAFSAEVSSGTGSSAKATAAVQGSVTPMWPTQDITAVLDELIDGIGGSSEDMKENVRTNLPRLNEMLSRILQWDTTQFAGPVVKDKRTGDTYSSVNFVTKLDHKEIHKRYPSISAALKFMAHVRLVITDLHVGGERMCAHTLVHFEFNTDSQTVTLKAFKKGGKLLWSTNGGLSPCVDTVGAPLNKAGGYRYSNHDLHAAPDLFVLADINAALLGLDFHLPTVALRLTCGYRNMTGVNIRLLKMFPTWASTLASFIVDIDGLFAELQKSFVLNLTIQTEAEAIAAMAKEKQKYEEQAEMDRVKAEALAAQRERRRSSQAAMRSRAGSNASAHSGNGTQLASTSSRESLTEHTKTNTARQPSATTGTGASPTVPGPGNTTGKKENLNAGTNSTSDKKVSGAGTGVSAEGQGVAVVGNRPNSGTHIHTAAGKSSDSATETRVSLCDDTTQSVPRVAVGGTRAGCGTEVQSQGTGTSGSDYVGARGDAPSQSLRNKVCVESGSTPMVLTFAFDASAPTSIFASIFQKVWDKLVDKLLWVEIFSYLDDLNTNVAEDCAIGIQSGNYT